MEEIQFIESMQTLEIRDGDILVFRIDRNITPMVHRDLAMAIKTKLPEKMKDVSVYILEPGTDMGVMRKEVAL